MHIIMKCCVITYLLSKVDVCCPVKLIVYFVLFLDSGVV